MLFSCKMFASDWKNVATYGTGLWIHRLIDVCLSCPLMWVGECWFAGLDPVACRPKNVATLFTACNFRNIEQIFTKFGVLNYSTVNSHVCVCVLFCLCMPGCVCLSLSRYCPSLGVGVWSWTRRRSDFEAEIAAEFAEGSRAATCETTQRRNVGDNSCRSPQLPEGRGVRLWTTQPRATKIPPSQHTSADALSARDYRHLRRKRCLLSSLSDRPCACRSSDAVPIWMSPRCTPSGFRDGLFTAQISAAQLGLCRVVQWSGVPAL